ncbi:hypothetical protein D3C85_1599820 [compost metagenome]
MVRADADVQRVRALQQHEFGLARRVVARHLKDIIGGQQRGGQRVERRHGGGRLHAQRLQFFDVMLDGGGVAASPAGNDESLDVEGERAPAGYLEVQCRHGVLPGYEGKGSVRGSG